jgi:hypothetical protein
MIHDNLTRVVHYPQGYGIFKKIRGTLWYSCYGGLWALLIN